jgi:hypothetical protein
MFRRGLPAARAWPGADDPVTRKAFPYGPSFKRARADVDGRPRGNARVLDFATFIYNAASLLSQIRSAIRRHDVETVHAAVSALRDVGEDAGAERMAALCDALGEIVRGPLGTHVWDEIDAIAAAIIDELEQVTGELQLSHSA